MQKWDGRHGHQACTGEGGGGSSMLTRMNPGGIQRVYVLCKVVEIRNYWEPLTCISFEPDQRSRLPYFRFLYNVELLSTLDGLHVQYFQW